MAGVVVALAAASAAAQDNAVKSAADAFGERVGTEQSGLYSETQVRGFDLNDSGAYRIDEAYFNRAAVLNDPVLAGVSVRVGVNAVRLEYPAPSGVVNYRLRSAGPANELRVGLGFRDFGTQVVQADGTLRAGNLSFAGGAIWRPRWGLAQGNEGKAVDVGGVGAWQIAPAHRLRVFATTFDRDYDGDYAVVPSEAAVPRNLEPLRNYSPAWARSSAVSSNAGVLYDARVRGFTIDAAAFRSVFDYGRIDYTLISADRAGLGTATTYLYPERAKRSDSAEVRIGRRFEARGLSHLTSVSLRGGRSIVGLSSPHAIPLGTFDVRRGRPHGAEQEWSGTRGTDVVEQTTASAVYGLAWGERLQLRAALHRTRYGKEVLSVAGVRTDGVEDSTLYNASAIVGFTDRTALFTSWVTGLEESGVAPASALNRDEVLPPVEAEQLELGVRHVIVPGLTLIGAVFDVSKPTNGFRADRSFGVVGEVRNRGIEASIAGKIGEKTRVVVGAVAFESKVTGPLVDAGIVGSHAAGVSQRIVNLNLERQIGKNWSVDAGVSHAGERWADSANTFRTPAVTMGNLGARSRFELAGRPAELRLLASNITGEDGYWVTRTGVMTPVSPRTVRALLTVTFGPGR